MIEDPRSDKGFSGDPVQSSLSRGGVTSCDDGEEDDDDVGAILWGFLMFEEEDDNEGVEEEEEEESPPLEGSWTLEKSRRSEVRGINVRRM